MSVGITKQDPFDVLAGLIRAAVPAVAGTRTMVGPQPASTASVWPRLVIRPGKFTPEFSQPEKLARETDPDSPKFGRPKHYHPDGDPTRIIVSMGRYTGFAMLSVGAASIYARREIEQAILNLFNAQRGSLKARVPDCGNAWHRWDLADAEWSDEMVFDQAVFAEINLVAVHPILVELSDVRTIDSLRFQFTESTVIPFASIPTAEIEELQIAADGSLSRPAP